MKTIIFSLLMAGGLTAFGQFIPQPNAYNPDANGDSFIGVDDVMGTLALYNSPFNNGDSINTMELTFNGDAIIQAYNGLNDTISVLFPDLIYIPEEVDILVLDALDSENNVDASFALPEGPGFKSLLVFMSSPAQYIGTFFHQSNPNFYVEQFEIYNPNRPMYLLMLRLPNGKWYRPHTLF